jgi:Queuosine salvage protein
MAISVPDQVRTACAWVAERARSAQIEEGAIEAYAAGLSEVGEMPPPDPASGAPYATYLDIKRTATDAGSDRGARISFIVCLDAINFGSGWWPTIRKRPGHSGYFTIAAGLTERFRAEGAWSADELARLSARDVADATGQDPDHPLMAEYTTALRDVGQRVQEDLGGSFEALVEAANGSAVALADLLAGWDAFADASSYDDRPVPFYKRAQIAAADLNRAGLAELSEEERLTAFADNLVPHVLRVDGILRLDPALEARIDAGELLAHGSSEEVELRACAVHAVELLADVTDRRISPAQIDAALWNRGGTPRYKSIPRPRSRNTAY